MALSAALGIVCAAFAETPQAVTKSPSARTKSASAKTGKTVSAAKVTAKAVPTRTATSKTKSAAGKNNAKTSKTSAGYRRSYQQQPSAERYQEIQQALADRGYFEGSADGQWGATSVEALKRFQREQSLTDDGKIGSLSLIALGLGPRRAAPPEVSASKATQP